MSNDSIQTQRQGVVGFEHGGFYTSNPTTGDIVVDSTAARSGSYGCHVTAQSGVSTSFVINASTSFDQEFLRFYIKPLAFPTVTRRFWAEATASTALGLRITPTGTVEVIDTSLRGTSVSSLVANAWNMVELGLHYTGDRVKLRLNGNDEVAWVACSAITSQATWVFGAIDTAASAFEYYLDDIVWDVSEFPGYGRTGRAVISSVVTDSANWVLTGSSKVAAITPAIPFDDTTYIQSSAVATITFGWNALPSNVSVVHGMMTWFRYIRGGGSNGILREQRGWRGAGAPHALTQSAQLAPSAAYAVGGFTSYTAHSIFGLVFPAEFVDELTVGVNAADSNAVRVSALWVEYDYDDRADARFTARPVMLADFESDPRAEMITANETINGTVQRSTAWAKFGVASVELVHASGSRSTTRTQLDLNGLFGNKILGVSFWTYVVSRPSSGSMDLWYYVETSTILFQLSMTSTGALIARIGATSSSATAAGTIPITDETHISIEIVIGSASTANTRMKVWVDDVLLITLSAVSSVTSLGGAPLPTLGSTAAVTGGSTVRYDGYCIDLALRHTSHLKFVTLRPGSSGVTPVAGFTANGAATKWECVDDVTSDSDTTYVRYPSGLGTALFETYEVSALPANAVHVLPYIRLYFMARGESSGWTYNIVTSLPYDGYTQTNHLAARAAGTSYSLPTIEAPSLLGPNGKLTPALLAAFEIGLRQTDNARAGRLTQIAITIAYTAINDYARANSNPLAAIG